MDEVAPKPSCLNCGAAFQPDRISRKRRFAECAHCGTLHNVSSFLPSTDQPEQLRRLPDRIYFGESRTGATIEVKEEDVTAAWLVYLAGLLAIATAMAFSIWVLSRPSRVPTARAVTLILVGFTLLLGVPGILKSRNRTRIMLDRLAIVVSSRPLPQRPKTFNIRGIRCAIVVLGPAQARGMPRYMLVLVTRQNTAHRLTKLTYSRREAEAAMDLLNTSMTRLKSNREPRASAARMLEESPARELTRRHREKTSHLTGFRKRSRRSPVHAAAKDLACTACGAPLPLDTINREELAATCRYCGVVNDLRVFLKVDRNAPVRQRSYLPENIKLAIGKSHASLTITNPAPRRDLWWFVGLFAKLALLPVVLMVPHGLHYTYHWEYSKAFLLCGGLVVPLLMLLFFAATMTKRQLKTVATMSGKLLTRGEVPKRISGEVAIPSADVTGFVAEEIGAEEPEQGGFAVFAQTTGGNRVPIAENLPSAACAIIIVDAFRGRLTSR